MGTYPPFDSKAANLASPARLIAPGQAGKLVVYSDLHADPVNTVAGPGGLVWVLNWSTRAAGTLGLDGSLSYYTVGGTSISQSIALGPDGAMWINIDPGYAGGGETGHIARLACDGTYTEFAIHGRPTSVTAGPDGAVWVAEGEDARIVRVALDGAETDFQLPSGRVTGNIVGGPDGAVWFKTDGGAGRLTPDGSYSGLSSVAGYGVVYFDRSRDLWVGGSDLDHWSTTGTLVARFALSAMYVSMVGARDGSLWLAYFTQQDYNLWIARVTAGSLESFGWTSLFAEPVVGNLVIASGSLWFGTDAGVARYTPPEPIL